jgi:hypothetical protein
MKRQADVKTVKLTVTVDETTWKRLRGIAESERSGQGRASLNALINKLIAEYLAKKGGK